VFQTHVSSVSSVFFYMLQVLHLNISGCCTYCNGVSTIYPKCFIYFRRMLQMFHLYVAKVDLVFECCSWTHLSQLRACSCWARVHACGRLAASSSLTHLPPKAFGRWRPNIPVPSPNEHQLCSALASPSPFPSPSSQVATARRWSEHHHAMATATNLFPNGSFMQLRTLVRHTHVHADEYSMICYIISSLLFLVPLQIQLLSS
jgi:hypothetical protein